MSSTNDSGNGNNGAGGNSTSFWSDYSVQLVALFFCLVSLMRCCANHRFRAIWWRRIRLCRWNVPTDDIEVVSFFRSDFTPRYPRGDPRHVPSPADAEEAKKEIILEKLEGFTKVRSFRFGAVSTDPIWFFWGWNHFEILILVNKFSLLILIMFCFRRHHASHHAEYRRTWSRDEGCKRHWSTVHP